MNPNRLEQVVELNQQGLLNKDIANKLGMQQSAVHYNLKRSGLERNRGYRGFESPLDYFNQHFKGKKLILNIFPSVDTGTCATSVRNFNEKASQLDNTAVLCISRDLPFAQNRFCGAENIENVLTLSDFANGSFGKDYGLTIMDGALANLHSRCIVVLDELHKIIHTEQVDEITSEPNYETALAVLS